MHFNREKFEVNANITICIFVLSVLVLFQIYKKNLFIYRSSEIYIKQAQRQIGDRSQNTGFQWNLRCILLAPSQWTMQHT
jgi:hypothetical protein